MDIPRWDMTSHAGISRVAKAFNVPASTLRYWESMGLLSVSRDRQNRYRDFSYQDMITMCDLMDLRNLGISIKQMRRFPHMGLDELELLYAEQSGELQKEIERLEATLRKVNASRQLIRQFNELMQSDDVRMSTPDVDMLIPHTNLYSSKTWQKYFSGEYEFGNVQLCSGAIPQSGWICTAAEEDAAPLWVCDKKNRRFAECALRIAVDDRQDSNYQQTRKRFEAMGYKTGVIVSRFVATAAEGPRSDFYKGWIEIY